MAEKRKIKIRAYYTEYLRQQIRFYENWGWKLLIVRPAKWYEWGGDQIAEMEIKV